MPNDPGADSVPGPEQQHGEGGPGAREQRRGDGVPGSRDQHNPGSRDQHAGGDEGPLDPEVDASATYLLEPEDLAPLLARVVTAHEAGTRRVVAPATGHVLVDLPLSGPDDVNASLPFASSLCGACFDACPVRIDIPHLLVQQRAAAVAAHTRPTGQDLAMKAAAIAMTTPGRFKLAEKALGAGRILAGRKGRITSLPWPMSGWTNARDAPAPPKETFRQWWARTHPEDESEPGPDGPADGASSTTGGDDA